MASAKTMCIRLQKAKIEMDLRNLKKIGLAFPGSFLVYKKWFRFFHNVKNALVACPLGAPEAFCVRL